MQKDCKSGDTGAERGITNGRMEVRTGVSERIL